MGGTSCRSETFRIRAGITKVRVARGTSGGWSWVRYGAEFGEGAFGCVCE